jgi:hypothetical protein
MRTIKPMLILGLFALATASMQVQFSAQSDPPRTDETFIPFKSFIKQVQRAKYEDYEYTKVKNEEAFEEMQKHILYMYECVTDVTSFMQGPEYVDCIKILEQPSFCHSDDKEIPNPPFNSTPPGKSRECVPGVFKDTDSPLKLGLKDRFGNRMSCPDNYIPMARLTLEKLTRFPTLRDVFAKHFPPPRPGDVNEQGDTWVHKYAHAYQTVPNYGGNSWLNVWNPVCGDHQMTISQQWYTGGPWGTDKFQSVEGGWQFQRHFQTKNVLLFIFWTRDGYNHTGCYNLECTGFKQLNNNWFLGGEFDHYSTRGGTQWGFEMQWKLYQDKWYLFLKGRGDYELVGFYPTSIYNGGQLSRQA